MTSLTAAAQSSPTPLSKTPPLPAYIQRPADAADLFAIYPGTGLPSGAEPHTWHEQAMQAPDRTTPSVMVRNVALPTITWFKPAPGTANGTSIIVAPGGASHFLMMALIKSLVQKSHLPDSYPDRIPKSRFQGVSGILIG